MLTRASEREAFLARARDAEYCYEVDHASVHAVLNNSITHEVATFNSTSLLWPAVSVAAGACVP